MGFISSLLGKKKKSPKDLISDRQIELVQHSFTLITPHRKQFSDLFFAKLFQVDPVLESSLKLDPSDQERKMIPMLSAVVNGLVDIELIIPILHDFGRTHAEYNVEDTHYEAVKQALLYALETVLEQEWTSEISIAWNTCYTVIIDIMKEAATSINQMD
ncbi:globin domain-containing protein [Flammeovirga aprica]|uniref:Hemin receptor n=1 Tax=Flammeovirga aprica JL-4 TaxID=694437 RepID=A0A7X9RSS6_9BACT|nr:globin domain-containing protein [Flammeovirga aprica]NME67471.1 hemin receptor [Flammeovirga aprica JL-4]